MALAPQPVPRQSLRRHPRVAVDLPVKLLGPTREIGARAIDLSMGGMCVQDAFEKLGRALFDRVAVQLPGEPEVVLRVRVARRQGARLALIFEELDWDDLFYLARYLSPRF